MKTPPLLKSLLADLPLSEVDICRLFIEFTEVAGVACASRAMLIDTFRKVMYQGVSCMRSSEMTMPFASVVEASLASRYHRRPSTVSDLRSYTRRILRYGDWAILPLRNITIHQCRQMLGDLFGHSPFVFRKAKTILHSIFAYGQRQGWCVGNPVDGIESPPVTEETVNILSIGQIHALLRACEARDLREMDASLRLMLWCGVRPGEVRRLHWKDVDMNERVVYIDGMNSKTGGPRVVPLRGAALALLNSTHDPEEYIAPRNWNRMWVRLRSRAGLLRQWQRDSLRHTFASMNLKRFHNISMLQEEMGHRDTTLLRTRYLNMRDLTAAAAARFFRSDG